MSSDQTYSQETDFRLERRRLSELIKNLKFDEEKIEKRMKQLKEEPTNIEEPIYDIED